MPWKPSDVWTVSVRCCTRCLHAQRLSGRFSTSTGVLGVDGPVAPLWTIDLLVETSTETLAHSPSGSNWRMGQLLNLAERRWGLTTAREPVAHRPGQRPIPLGVGSLISHSHVGGCVP